MFFLIVLSKRSVQLNPGRVIPKQKSLRKQHQLELIVWLCNPFLFSLHLFREYVRAYFLLSNIFSSFHPKFFSLFISSDCHQHVEEGRVQWAWNQNRFKIGSLTGFVYTVCERVIHIERRIWRVESPGIFKCLYHNWFLEKNYSNLSLFVYR